MSGQVNSMSSYFSYVNQQPYQEDDFDAKILKAVKKEMSTDSELTTSAPPIVATTITLETIQDVLQTQGYSIDQSQDESPCGPFEDTRFDQVVDVQTNSDGLISEEEEINIMNISDFGDISSSDTWGVGNDLLNYDSGIEAEIEENKAQVSARRSKTKQKRVKRSELENINDNANESEEDTVSKFHCQYLWEFLQSLLSCKKFNNKYIEWKNHPEGIFKLNDHHSVARLWGIQKKRKNMTYDKLSRALRYYYGKNILQKVDGERLTYKFCKSVYEYKS